jgi:hypothetical protein
LDILDESVRNRGSCGVLNGSNLVAWVGAVAGSPLGFDGDKADLSAFFDFSVSPIQSTHGSA